MTAKRCLTVVNPRGGTQRGLVILEQVRPVFEEAGWELAVRVTEFSGHAQAIARALALDGYDSLCVIGGDGTIHEVVNGLMERDQSALIPLGFIPAGSGNTLHQHLQYVDPVESARRIVAGRTCPLDAIKVTMGQQVVYCVDIIGWGGVADKVPNPPSSYFADHVFGCFFDDPHGLTLINEIGEDNITYESDYPHSDSTWPRTREIAEKQGIRGYLVDGATDLRREWLEGAGEVGVTAGASAPEVLVQEVVATLRAWGGEPAVEVPGRAEHIVFGLPRPLRHVERQA